MQCVFWQVGETQIYSIVTDCDKVRRPYGNIEYLDFRERKNTQIYYRL